MLALDPTTGAQVWRQDIGIPMRAAPVVVGGRMFVVTYDNQLWALSAEDGAVQWSNACISETAGLLGAASLGVARIFACGICPHLEVNVRARA